MTLNQIIGFILLVAVGGAATWVYWRLLQKTEDPGKIFVKTIITIIVVVSFSLYARSLLSTGGMVALMAVAVALVGGVILMLLWYGHVTNAIAKPFEDLFTGGDAEADPEPYYSVARTKRQQNKIAEAIQLIDEQLELFPDDFNGLMLKAEIQAIDQQNLSGAAETVETICGSQSDHPRNVSVALSALADWHLQVYRNREAALECFERIRKTFPKHRVAMDAAQRIAHMPSQEMLDGRMERRTIVLQERKAEVIRDNSDVNVEVEEESPEDAIARLESQVDLHPLDHEAREQLAGMLGEHRGDLEGALMHLEFLLKQPQQTRQTKVKLLNRMTDFSVRYGDDLVAARKPLDRIIELFPDSAPAEQAMQRKMLLRKEFQGKEKNRDIHLGSYERDVGLR